jgi:ABC-type transporter Mla MlaB component
LGGWRSGEAAIQLISLGVVLARPMHPCKAAMLKIVTIETNSSITLELHGRLIGPWVPLLESLWKSKEGRASAGRTVVVDLTDVRAIDGAACYLLRLMEAKNVRLTGGGIGIRALLSDEGGKQNEIR